MPAGRLQHTLEGFIRDHDLACAGSAGHWIAPAFEHIREGRLVGIPNSDIR
jgi:hypothetical protein